MIATSKSGPKQVNMGPKGPGLVKIRLQQPKTDKNTPKQAENWPNIGQKGRNRITIGLNSPKQSNNGPKHALMCKNWQSLAKMAKIGQNRSKSNHIGSNGPGQNEIRTVENNGSTGSSVVIRDKKIPLFMVRNFIH